MEENNKMDFLTLRTRLLSQLQEHQYSYNTIKYYEIIFNHIERFLKENNLSQYTPEIGQQYYQQKIKGEDYSKSYKTNVSTVIKRLNTCYEGKEYISSSTHKEWNLSEEFSKYTDKYLEKCKLKGNRARTLQDKKYASYRLCMIFEKRGFFTFGKLTAPVVIECVSLVKGISAKEGMKEFLTYLYEEGCTKYNFSMLIAKNKRQYKIPSTYTPQEVKQIEQSVDRESTIGKRNYAIILLASRLAMRAGDIASLTFNELDFTNNRICFTQNKTGNINNLPLLPEVKEALQDYINNARPKSSLNTVFLNSFAPYSSISRASITALVQKNIVNSGVDITNKKYGPHSLRASLATSMVNDGVEYQLVQKVLGHVDASAIKHYAKLDLSYLRMCALPVNLPTGNFKYFLEEGCYDA